MTEVVVPVKCQMQPLRWSQMAAWAVPAGGSASSQRCVAKEGGASAIDYQAIFTGLS